MIRDPSPILDREARRAHLLDAAVRAIRRDGPDVSMEAIATEAGITKPILYTHFGDKAGLADALADRLSSSIAGSLGSTVVAGDLRGTVTAMIAAYVEMVENEPNVYWFVVSGVVARDQPGVRKLIDDSGALVAEVLRTQLRAAGLDEQAAEPWAFGIIGLVDQAVGWWLARRTISRDSLVEHLAALVGDGLIGNGLGG